ncbi:MAG: M48 family metalloprotease, partial [Cyanobacteria bacterium NC_groundwater_1444_Ag_S-0.65um_54_12]|nr:M48 family metalloprotease [Cyanobacteria bacterium NC_groundwater_1444_Ag_S-0.65um_54_12]
AAAPELHRSVANLAQRSGLPMPRIFIIPDATPNAFATGRSPHHAVIAVTEGLLRIMQEDELAGVLAHELAHVRNRDTLIMAVAATMAATITFIADMARWALIFGHDREENNNPIGDLLLLMLAPLAAMLIQLAVSRSREFAADASAAKLTGRPLSLANGLLQLERANQVQPLHHATPATAHLFIVNPFGAGGLIMRMFSTHPSIQQRVERLRQMATLPV